MSMWIGNFVFLFIIVPAVVLVLEQIREPIRQIGAYAKDITESVTLFPKHLEGLEELNRTRELVKQANVEMVRYVRALDNLR